MKIHLAIDAGPDGPASFEGPGPVIRVGRDPGCELSLQGGKASAVSRQHARIELSRAGATVADAGSSNGTLLNDRLLDGPARLRVGDRVQMGFTGPTLTVVKLDLTAPPSKRRGLWLAVLIASALLVFALATFAVLWWFVFRKSTVPTAPPARPAAAATRAGNGGPKKVGPKVVAQGHDAPQQGNKEEAQSLPNLIRRPKVKNPPLDFPDGPGRSTLNGPDSLKAFERLSEDVQRKLIDGLNPGKGGGGKGPGVGEGSRGEDKSNQSRREKRLLRWSMRFNTRTGEDYVRQLRGVGAILGIPVREGRGQQPEYKVVRELARPARLQDEDIAKLNRIFWIDDNPRSVVDVMRVLQVRLQPSHFIAFMPIELEQKLFDLERAYKGLAEDDILETKFRIVESGDAFRPEVLEQTPKR